MFVPVPPRSVNERHHDQRHNDHRQHGMRKQDAIINRPNDPTTPERRASVQHKMVV